MAGGAKDKVSIPYLSLPTELEPRHDESAE